MSITSVYAFLQVLQFKSRLSTKHDYFSTHNIFMVKEEINP
jgi:hypothetical protein